MTAPDNKASYLIAAFYKFVRLPDHAGLQRPLQLCCEGHHVRGTILLANEGINGTIAGPPEGVSAVLAFLKKDPRLADLTHKASHASHQPFSRMKVKRKKEIVTLGVPEVDPSRMAGTYVKPEDWNKLLDDPSVVVVDVRNDYEVAIGTFEGSVNPLTKSFSELPDWVRTHQALRERDGKKPRVAMFCTGGIRCEKSTAFLRSEGFHDVYHLEGGILKYLETVPPEESRWQGECFVFDERVSVSHGVEPGQYKLCRSCRHPLREEDKLSPLYVPGVSCARCHGQTTDEQKRRFKEREKQVALAKARNEVHIGARMDVKRTASSNGTLPILYSFRRCPYAMRARFALLVSGQACELREVTLRNKPRELLRASPKGTVPVLVTAEGKVVDESLDIMRWALERNDPPKWLEPEVDSLDAMLALIKRCDVDFKVQLDRYKYPGRYEGCFDFAIHRAEGAKYLEHLSDRLAETAFLFGKDAALADMAIVPFVRQFAEVDKGWFSEQPWPSVHAWLKSITESALFGAAMEKFEPWIAGQERVVFGRVA